jgi:CRP/FNR family transcriptional regulator
MTFVMRAEAGLVLPTSAMNVEEAFERVAFLKSLEAKDRARLAPYAQLRTLSEGDGCWAEGKPADEFLFVVRGRVKLVKGSEQGRETIVEMGAPGELLCGNAVFCFAPYCCNSVAMESSTELLSLPRRDVMELVERTPQAARALVRELTERGMNMCRRLDEVGGAPVERRMAMLFLKLADRAGVARPDEGISIPIRLSRQDLGDLCGTTIETAIRVMSKFKKADLVRTTTRGFLIPNRAALEAVSRG